MQPFDRTSVRKWIGTGSINIFGRPFAGKDTQAAKLAELFDAIVLGGGDILRNSTIPPHVDAALRRGELIPSDDYVNIVLPYLSKQEFKGKPLILSSVGRWSGEETGVVQALEQADHSLKLVIYLDIAEATVRDRWQKLEAHDDRGGRYDDTADVLDKRLLEYRQKTLPVIDSYQSRNLLVKIDGNQSPEAVFKDIQGHLVSLAKLI
jgi:adenylate kinase